MFLQPLKLKSSNLFPLNISYLVLKHLSLPWGRERLLKTTTALVVGLHLHRLKVKPSKQLLVHLQNCTRFQNIIKCNWLHLNFYLYYNCSSFPMNNEIKIWLLSSFHNHACWINCECPKTMSLHWEKLCELALNIQYMYHNNSKL